MNDLIHTATIPAPETPKQVLKPTMKEIKQSVARAAGIPIEAMVWASRKREYAIPRQYAMYLCLKLTGSSLTEVANQFGRRHHTTVLFAREKVGGMRRDSPMVRDLLDRQIADIMAVVEKRRHASALADEPITIAA